MTARGKNTFLFISVIRLIVNKWKRVGSEASELKGPTGAAGAPGARIGGWAPGALKAPAGALYRKKKVEPK